MVLDSLDPESRKKPDKMSVFFLQHHIVSPEEGAIDRYFLQEDVQNEKFTTATSNIFDVQESENDGDSLSFTLLLWQ